MTTFLIAALWGTLLMAQATDNLHVEPGKQLPQSLAIHVGEKDSERDVTIRYLLFTPESYQPTGEKWPLLLFLHGYGESSDDNLDLVKTHGPAKIASSRSDFTFVVITPQCPPPIRGDAAKPGAVRSQDEFRKIQRAWKPEELIQLVDNAIQHLNVDPNRVYVTGLSMGGYGTWRLASTYPDRFAAAVPICGGGEPDTMAGALARVPIWAFHGAKDPVVPLAESQNMVDAVQKAGGDIRLTVYPEAQHNSWTETYDNQKVYDWLLFNRLPHATQ